MYQYDVRGMTALRLSQVRSALSWEIIIVDDNSPDGTQDVAKQLASVYGEDKIVRGAPFPAVLILILLLAGFETSPRKARTWVCPVLRHYLRGLTPRFRTAYIHGLDFCTGDFVIIMDADFSHHVRLLGSCTLVCSALRSPNLFLNSFGASRGHSSSNQSV
jgi:glycosyltransferase involved in cell wall biosynthesis